MGKKLVCEFLGTAFLLATVVGSGLLVNNVDSSNQTVNLLCISAAVGAMLYSLIIMFGTHSNHFNPLVTLLTAAQGNLGWKWVLPYSLVQITGATAGVMLANMMFEMDPVSLAVTARTGYGQWLGELIATFGLVGIIMSTAKLKPQASAQATVLYIVGAIFATSSTCFANPAVTIARMFTQSGTGIRAFDVPAFIVFQLVGGILAYLLYSWLQDSEAKAFTTDSKQVPVLPLPAAKELSAAIN